ncbi:MAG: hypothetical protein JSS27_09480 [Planctomycetes bacterium]|nr:hypothetical protein [Planctomycetota bacterium]
MTGKNQDNLNRAAQAWRQLTSAAQRQALPASGAGDDAAPADFAARVLTAVASGPRLKLAVRPQYEAGQQRLVSAAAWFALAASLLVCLWSWSDLQAAWTPPPEIAAPLDSLELWP